MIIYVHIKEKVFAINCGEGAQSISWLGNVAVSRYDEDSFGLHTGLCMGMRLENNKTLDVTMAIGEILKDKQHIYVHFEEDTNKPEANAKRGVMPRNPIKKENTGISSSNAKSMLKSEYPGASAIRKN